jgi:DNA-binding Lrp family transcriptional regulator
MTLLRMADPAPISTLRFALRAANNFIIDGLTAYRSGRDFTDALILATLVQCNSAPVSADPVLQRRYATYEAVAPDHLRRPISINAIATSLGLPFETVRRRIKRLIADGGCEVVPEGVRLAAGAMASPGARAGLDTTSATVRALYERLKANGCLELMNLPAPTGPAWSPETPPVRIIWRAASDYLLRMMEHLLPNFPSLSRAFIVLAVFRVNTVNLPDAVRGGEGLMPEDFVPDSYRRPARASDVATLLGLPHETVRRHLAALVEEERCVRVRDGFVVPAEVLARQNVVNAWGANFRHLSRMFAELSELGVLAMWDEDLAAESTAA